MTNIDEEVSMQAQRNDKSYTSPEPYDKEGAERLLKSKNVKRVLLFQSHDEITGKPTPELRRAWRRWNKRRV